MLEEVLARHFRLGFAMEDSRCVRGPLALDSSRQEFERWQTGHLGTIEQHSPSVLAKDDLELPTLLLAPSKC